MGTIGQSLSEGFFMLWATLWALILGFTLSGIVQAFVSRAQLQRVMGDHRPRTMVRTSLLGAASSSCSYAASALARTLFARGADFTTAMVFMIASTNLVVELGIVLWLLIGWQFALAEFVGGALMIAHADGDRSTGLPRAVPRGRPPPRRPHHARPRARGFLRCCRHLAGPCCRHLAGPLAVEAGLGRRRVVHDRRPADAASRAGARALSSPGSSRSPCRRRSTTRCSSPAMAAGRRSRTRSSGPVVAFVSFVCSIGNVPLAAALWTSGVSFGGVVAFLFADLLSAPLVLIYCKLYGRRQAVVLVGVLWAVMSVGGLLTELVFRGAGLLPTPALDRAGRHRLPLERHDVPQPGLPRACSRSCGGWPAIATPTAEWIASRSTRPAACRSRRPTPVRLPYGTG